LALLKQETRHAPHKRRPSRIESSADAVGAKTAEPPARRRGQRRSRVDRGSGGNGDLPPLPPPV